MAAVTVSRKRTIVKGNRREINATITVVTTGDTWVTGLKRVESVTTSDPAGITKATQSAGTVTFTGTTTDALVQATGY